MANAAIRQEINILDSNLAAPSNATTTSNEIVQLDTTQYNGATYYFEIVVKTDISTGGDSVRLRRNGTSTDDATITIPTLTTAYTLIRSSSFSPPNGQTEYIVAAVNGIVSASNIKSARIVILQNAATLTNTETQIEIGNASNTTATTDTALTNPKYWQYTSANWDGTITAYFEGTFLTGTSKSAATMTLQTSTSITAPSWSNVASSAVTTTGTVATRVRSGAITLTAGNWYRAVMKAGNSKSGITVYNAKIIIDQIPSEGVVTNRNSFVSIKGSGGTAEAGGMKFTPSSNRTSSVVILFLFKNASPTDNLTLEVLTGSITGTLIATSNTVDASTITSGGSLIPFTFASSISFASGTAYYFRLSRSGARDTTNFVNWSGQNINGGQYTEDSGVWSSESATNELELYIFGFTKLEPQYLLANTLFAAGTGLQTFLTKWDSTEWDDTQGGQPTFYFQAEAANDSTSDVTLEQADGGGTVTNSTVTNIDNAQISSAMTMPGNENLDTKATTNAGDVAGARILVVYAVNASPPPLITVYNGNQFFQLLGIGT